MHNSYLLVFVLILLSIQKVLSIETGNNDEEEHQFDDTDSIASDSFVTGKQGNPRDCLLKDNVLNTLLRDRRASISRPYFHHWRGSRDNTRYVSKNLLAFSPRLGKRGITGDESDASDLNTFLITLVGQLQRKNVNIIYEDATKICFSQMINDAFLHEILNKFIPNQRQQDEESSSKGKHPLLFRYRLGK